MIYVCWKQCPSLTLDTFSQRYLQLSDFTGKNTTSYNDAGISEIEKILLDDKKGEKKNEAYISICITPSFFFTYFIIIID